MKRYLIGLCLFAAVGLLTGCDTVQPSQVGTLVLEAYLEAGKALPPIRITRTSDTSESLFSVSRGVTDADVELVIDDVTVRYVPDQESAGIYRPESPSPISIVRPFAQFLLSVRAGVDQASAFGHIPPRILLSDVSVQVPDKAIEAILIDSLDIGLDSLDLALDAQQGFIYPVQVTLAWQSLDFVETSENEYWVETRLEPVTRFASSLIDFFLLPKQVLPEVSLQPDDTGALVWNGVYAVPVESADTPLPEHTLKVSLLRGDQSFALFETSRDNPGRREPVSNVHGGIGFVGGISLDTLRIVVE